MIVRDLGLLDYRSAWKLQEQTHDRVSNGADEELLFVEHPPVITYGRRPGVSRNLVASETELQRRGVTVVESDRGGDITFHGPGQLVAYPIIRLADHKLSVSGYVHKLEQLIVAALAHFGVAAHTEPTAVGVWVAPRAGDARSDVPFADTNPQPAKVAAIGVRIRRGVSLHGLALNVDPDLSFFRMIIPCGIADRPVTSMRQLLGDAAPDMPQVKRALAKQFNTFFNS